MRSVARRERGQASILLLVALLFAAAVVAGVARVGVAASQRAGAQAAADAAALAGAAQGSDAATDVAAANHAVVVSYRADEDDVVVTIERNGVQASSRARWVPSPIP